jgi:hypothetical protein
MSVEPRIEQLERTVAYLSDRLAIQDCIMRLSRGADRHDTELMASSFHPDAQIKHGNRGDVITGAEYGEWSNRVHRGGRFALHSHGITNMNVEIDGDVAYAESYAVVLFLSADQQTTVVAAARYVDELQRREGEWKIAKRRGFVDIAGDTPATYFGNARGDPVDPEEFWTKRDVSYQRPIDLSTPSPQWT